MARIDVSESNPDRDTAGQGAVAGSTGDGTQVELKKTHVEQAMEFLASRGYPPNGTIGKSVLKEARQRDRDSAGTVTPANAPVDPRLAIAQQIVDIVKESNAEQRAAIEEFIGTSIPELQRQVDLAGKGDKAALKSLTDLNSTMKDIPLPEYSGPALTSKEDLQRQKDAYAQQGKAYDKQGDAAALFKAQTGVGITAEERFMMEKARLEEEGSRRGAMEAQLSNLSARGARSGGADIAAMLGAQQTTSQNRALSDLGAQANAQQRAMMAMQGYGNTTAQMAGTAGQMSDTAQGMRDSGDVMSRFNTAQANQWNQWEGEFKTRQQENEWGRGKDMFSADTQTNQAAYNRGYDVYGANRDATAMKTGQYSQGATDITRALGGVLGVQSAIGAEAALNKPAKAKDDGPFGFLGDWKEELDKYDAGAEVFNF